MITTMSNGDEYLQGKFPIIIDDFTKPILDVFLTTSPSFVTRLTFIGGEKLVGYYPANLYTLFNFNTYLQQVYAYTVKWFSNPMPSESLLMYSNWTTENINDAYLKLES